MPDKVLAVLAAGGVGSRLAGDVPKQYRVLGGRPVILWSAAALAGAPGVGLMVAGVAKDMMEKAQELLEALEGGPPIVVVEGGPDRQATVRNCLEAAGQGFEVAVIHDAARPFARPELFHRVIQAAERTGAATAAVRPADTVKKTEEGRSETLDRGKLWLVQTPQAFRFELIRKAHREDGTGATDDTALVEALGASVEMIEGDRLNMKITTKEDWKVAAALAGSGAVSPL